MTKPVGVSPGVRSPPWPMWIRPLSQGLSPAVLSLLRRGSPCRFWMGTEVGKGREAGVGAPPCKIGGGGPLGELPTCPRSKHPLCPQRHSDL